MEFKHLLVILRVFQLPFAIWVLFAMTSIVLASLASISQHDLQSILRIVASAIPVLCIAFMLGAATCFDGARLLAMTGAVLDGIALLFELAVVGLNGPSLPQACSQASDQSLAVVLADGTALKPNRGDAMRNCQFRQGAFGVALGVSILLAISLFTQVKMTQAAKLEQLQRETLQALQNRGYGPAELEKRRVFLGGA